MTSPQLTLKIKKKTVNFPLRVGIGEAMKLRDDLGVDVDNVIGGENSIVDRILSDTWLLLDLLLFLTEKKRDELGISANEFADALGAEENEEVFDEAGILFLEALGASLPKLKRRVLKTLVEKIPTTLDEMEKKIVGVIGGASSS